MSSFQSLLEVDHVLRVQDHQVIDAVKTCALEIANFLNDLSNWPQPIFPDVTNCSRLEIAPFFFNTTETWWDCGNQLDEGEWQTVEVAEKYLSQFKCIYFTELFCKDFSSLLRTKQFVHTKHSQIDTATRHLLSALKSAIR